MFRREPTLWIAIITAILSLVVSFSPPWLTGAQAGLVIGLINAVAGAVTAVKVRPIAPAAFTYLVGVVVALATAYGLHVGQETVGAVDAVVLAVLALLTRGQVSPSPSDSRI